MTDHRYYKLMILFGWFLFAGNVVFAVRAGFEFGKTNDLIHLFVSLLCAIAAVVVWGAIRYLKITLHNLEK